MKLHLILLSVAVAPVLCEIIDPKPFENMQCVNSRFVIEEKSDATHIKIVTDSEETLLDVDSNIATLNDFNSLLTELTDLLYPAEHYPVPGNSSDYYIMKNKTDEGVIARAANKFGHVLFSKIVPGLTEGDTKCAHIHGFGVVIDPSFDVTQQDGYNMTALIWACMFGLKDTAKNIVEKGADVNMESILGVTPLLAAANTDQDELTEFLINKGADVNKGKAKPLHVAAYKGRVSTAQTLIKHGAPVNVAILEEGITPLHAAATMGYPKMIELLIKSGANVEAATSKGETPLLMAIMKLHLESCHKLIEAGADLNAKDKEGNSALMIAVNSFRKEDNAMKAVEHLLAHHNPDVNIRNNKGQTALSMATAKGFSKIQDLLKAKGAS